MAIQLSVASANLVKYATELKSERDQLSNQLSGASQEQKDEILAKLKQANDDVQNCNTQTNAILQSEGDSKRAYR